MQLMHVPLNEASRAIWPSERMQRTVRSLYPGPKDIISIMEHASIAENVRHNFDFITYNESILSSKIHKLLLYNLIITIVLCNRYYSNDSVVIEAMEGPLRVNICVGSDGDCGCGRYDKCPIKVFWEEVQADLVKALSNIDFGDSRLRY